MVQHRTLPQAHQKDPDLNNIFSNVFKRGMNQIITINGLPRTGKTTVALYLGDMLAVDRKGRHFFNPLTDIATNILEVMQLIEKKNKAGDVILWDEASVKGKGASSRDWQSELNQDMGSVFQIMGLKNQILIMTFPRNFLLEKQMRSLAHVEITTKYFDPEEMKVRAKIRWTYFDENKQKVGRKRTVSFVKGRKTKWNDVWIPVAHPDVWKVYKKKEKSFKPNWIKEFLEKIQAAKDRQEKKKYSINELVQLSVPHVSEMYNKEKGIVVGAWVRSVLEEQEGVEFGSTVASQVASALNRKIQKKELEV